MKKLFPVKHVMGYLFSLILSIVALSVVFFDLSLAVGMTILLVSAVIQMGVQLILFMHIGENGSKKELYTNIAYALFVGLVTIFGTLFTMIWGYR
ncbi:cytochrome aa3-600 menaquinol oxidase subunit 4 [Fontibacillus phaseoli]|uniref:Quinol oxidase subunit 4 n=1 Tax=Fontibacillus phaseoli TaxID=1416533 RepID=A0A369B9Y2_9BACL|nr:cytochrome aa3 quinol oxidase subunit IV [Fontibacillus phaseoli]RCX18125.1 cytochrome aa3-600 menaquinol oxidase subunit 4 [Fontibacillus phaseoli]